MIHIGRRLLNKKLFNDANNVNISDINNKITELNKVVFTLANRVLALEKDVINLKCINKNNKHIIKNTFDKDMPLL